MALTALNPKPVTMYSTPFDAATAFASAQTLTATGYFNNLNSFLDLGGSNPISDVGRTEGFWCLDITAADMSSGDESYQLALLGSNDINFGNGNVELLAFHDLAAVTAGRVIPTLLGASPALANLQIPFSNQMQKIRYRWLKSYAVLAGTSPSITLSSRISRAAIGA